MLAKIRSTDLILQEKCERTREKDCHGGVPRSRTGEGTRRPAIVRYWDKHVPTIEQSDLQHERCTSASRLLADSQAAVARGTGVGGSS